MAFKNQAAFIEALEKAGELVRIKEFVDPHLEITEVYDRVVKVNGPALLFENTGYDFPLLINAMGSYKRMCLVLGVNDMDEVSAEIETLMKTLMQPKDNIIEKLKLLPKLGQVASWMPKTISGKGACQEIVMKTPDINKLPVLTCWPEDGGPFLTLPIINTKDPNTNIRNVGLYRMQVFGPDLTAMHWHRHKVSAKHFMEYKKLGKRMPVAVALGGDPVYTYAATAPLPENVDEYLLAGFLRKKRVELVQCLTQDIQVPADADFVIEGYIDPDEELILEGPFGDHTGYYSLADYYPKFHITAITHKKNPVYNCTAVGIPPQEDAWIGKATERIFLAPIKLTMLPEIKDMELPIEGVFHNLTIVKIDKDYPGQGQKVMNAMWGAGQMMFNKILIVTDEAIDLNDRKSVAQIISNNVDPQSDIYFSQGPADVLDHSCTNMGFGGKVFIDATKKLEEEIRSKNIEAIDCSKIKINTERVKKAFPEIQGFNDQLLILGVSALIIAVEKNRIGHLKELSKQLFKQAGIEQIKFIIFVEGTVDAFDIADVIWRFTNNLDPKRDSIIIEAKDGKSISHVAFDGTKKTKKYDGFERDWPNIICSDEKTIQSIDEKWDKLGLGEFVKSPSLKYQNQMYGSKAVAED